MTYHERLSGLAWPTHVARNHVRKKPRHIEEFEAYEFEAYEWAAQEAPARFGQ